MGARGPAATPTAILKARGSWRAAEREGEVAFPDGTPECPAWLGVEAKAEWDRQIANLVAGGIACPADRALLAAYCEAWGEFVGLCYHIAEMTRHDYAAGYEAAIAAGLLNAKNKAVDRLTRLAGQFGFSPAARSRVKGAEKEASGNGPGKARFFAG